MKLEFESNISTLPYAVNNYPGGVSPEDSAERITHLLKSGIKAAQAGNRNEARQLLVQVTESEPKNETAWLWMASISEYPEELIIFLNNVLSINPNNTRALEWMEATKSLLANTFVQRGVEASQDVNKDFARQCFLQAIVHDNQNENAWQGLAAISDSIEEKISHLQKVLNINPDNSSAKNTLQAAKKQNAELILRKANSAAVAGEREAAREMLQEVFIYSPELEEAWILKAYLADSFSEKITCYEKVLDVNPENEMAISGLASLREMTAKTAAKKAEQAALVAETLKNIASEEVFTLSEDQYVFSEDEDEANYPTQKLELPPDFHQADYESENMEVPKISLTEQPTEFLNFDTSDTGYEDFYTGQESISQPIYPEHTADDKVSGEDNFMTYNTFDKPSLTPNEPANSDYIQTLEQAEENLLETYSDNKSEFAAPANGNFSAANHPKPSVEIATCPFCNAENEANAFVCGSCRTILTLSDVEMLLAHTQANRDMLHNAVGQMEAELNLRPFSADELKNLAIGHINLKNLRQGLTHLQKAAQMNPNDVMLYSQVNSLKIRLSEIEHQEILQSTMSKGRKILIVDDSATVRKLISSKLEKSGHEVVCAVDGIDALEKIKEFTPDLILLDIIMPQLDGYQVCKLIRTNESTKDVPIVMISGKDGFFDKVRGRMAGTTGYITKPFGPETLMKVVENYIIHKDEMMPDEYEDEVNSGI